MISAHRIGSVTSASGRPKWSAIDATTGAELEGKFVTATKREVNLAVEKAAHAFEAFRNTPVTKRAAFLQAIADNIEALEDTLIKRIAQESALGEARIRSERARTTAQLRMFADFILEGSWVDAVIDHGDPKRSPPKPDLRRMLNPIGPVVVFTASNFPLAYSTAGGDTASALAAGCPVIVKAHEAHPGTNALVAEAIIDAAKKTLMPDGVFSTVYAQGFKVGAQLVKHPLVQGVGFTGSRKGGRALFDLAAVRETPIPVFAEMSSVNPIFLLPGALKENSEQLAKNIAASINVGAGQFCTCPGLLIALDDTYTEVFVVSLKNAFEEYTPLTMLNSGIQQNYTKNKIRVLATEEVRAEYKAEDEINGTSYAGPVIASVIASDFLQIASLQEEVFGPFTMVIRCAGMEEMHEVARHLHPQLTNTLCGTDEELAQAQDLVAIFREKAGRLVFNGVPTGVEVGHAIVHGGPYPATTDSRFTSVGTSAIRRWARPVVYQNCPESLLPEALKDGNELGIWRMVDGIIGKR